MLEALPPSVRALVTDVELEARLGTMVEVTFWTTDGFFVGPSFLTETVDDWFLDVDSQEPSEPSPPA